MKKTVTIILAEKNITTNPLGRIQKVSRGHAFNYLIPKKIAKMATKGQIKHLNMLHEMISNSKNLTHKKNKIIQDNINNINTIHIRKKCGSNQLIFGSISEQDIAKHILYLTGQTIDKKQITIINSKKLGKYMARIMIKDNMEVLLSLHIIPRTI